MAEETLHSLDDLQSTLAKLVKQLGPYAIVAGVPAMQETLEYLREQIPPYPTDAPTVSGLSTEKSIRWFFWAVKNDKVPGWKWVPGQPGKPAHPEGRYKQTGHLGQSFTYDVIQDGADIIGIIGTNTPYAPWVVGPPYPGEDFNGQTMYQARVHENRWWTFQEVIDDNIESAWKIFDEELEKRIVLAFENGA